MICPRSHSQMAAELGLALGSPECKMDPGTGQQAWVQTLHLRQDQPDLGWDPLQPPRGQSQGLVGSLGDLKYLPRSMLKRQNGMEVWGYRGRCWYARKAQQKCTGHLGGWAVRSGVSKPNS